MKRFVVTGATGFVGSALVRELRARGIPAVGVGRRAAPEVDCVVASYEDSARLHALLRPGDVVVHLAARAHQKDALDDTAFDGNARATVGLLDAARARGVARFVFVSSIGVHGVSTKAAPFSERDVPSPVEPYARSKLACERLVTQAAIGGGLDYTIVRPPLVYGPGAPGNFAKLAHAVTHGWPLPLGAVRNQRSFVALASLVDFLIVCGQHSAARRQTFLVADGTDLSTPQWITGMADAVGRRARLIPIPERWLRRAGTLLRRQAAVQRICDSLQVDAAFARRTLGWSPVVTVEEGLRAAMAQYRR